MTQDLNRLSTNSLIAEKEGKQPKQRGFCPQAFLIRSINTLVDKLLMTDRARVAFM